MAIREETELFWPTENGRSFWPLKRKLCLILPSRKQWIVSAIEEETVASKEEVVDCFDHQRGNWGLSWPGKLKQWPPKRKQRVVLARLARKGGLFWPLKRKQWPVKRKPWPVKRKQWVALASKEEAMASKEETVGCFGQ